MKIYLASSWKNQGQPAALKALRDAGHEVYDFRNPEPGQQGFAWKECVEPGETLNNPDDFRNILRRPPAVTGFRLDMTALNWCEVCILLCPCGNDAHLELGYATGKGKQTIVVLDSPIRDPGLMWRMVTHIVKDIEEAIDVMHPKRLLLDESLPSYFDYKNLRGFCRGCGKECNQFATCCLSCANEAAP